MSVSMRIQKLDLTYRSCLRRVAVTPYRGTGCQGFIGPFPSAFLDKHLKN